MKDEKSAILKDFGEFGLPITDQQAEQFAEYYHFLIEKNQVMNLTAITEFDQVVEKHFLDSVSPLLYFAELFKGAEGIKIADVGSGAGFPGIPLKITIPESFVTLFDSLGKRVDFLAETCQKLEFKGTEAIFARAEDAGRDAGYREHFDLVVARAVAPLPVLAEYGLPLAKVGGCFLVYKGPDADVEIAESGNALRTLGGSVERVEQFSIGENKRTLILIRKTAGTPDKYPRRAGIPSKRPL